MQSVAYLLQAVGMTSLLGFKSIRGNRAKYFGKEYIIACGHIHAYPSLALNQVLPLVKVYLCADSKRNKCTLLKNYTNFKNETVIRVAALHKREEQNKGYNRYKYKLVLRFQTISCSVRSTMFAHPAKETEMHE